MSIAVEACQLSGDTSPGVRRSWSISSSSLLHNSFPFVISGFLVHPAGYNSSYIRCSRYAILNLYLRCDTRCEWSDARDYDFVELHQLHSPKTVHEFLDRLLGESRALGTALDETSIFAKYIVDAWRGIIRSRGILP